MIHDLPVMAVITTMLRSMLGYARVDHSTLIAEHWEA
jgi:hypothetical protein